MKKTLLTLIVSACVLAGCKDESKTENSADRSPKIENAVAKVVSAKDEFKQYAQLRLTQEQKLSEFKALFNNFNQGENNRDFIKNSFDDLQAYTIKMKADFQNLNVKSAEVQKMVKKNIEAIDLTTQILNNTINIVMLQDPTREEVEKILSVIQGKSEQLTKVTVALREMETAFSEKHFKE